MLRKLPRRDRRQLILAELQNAWHRGVKNTGHPPDADNWQRQLLVPMAREMNLIAAEHTITKLCVGRGWLVLTHSTHRRGTPAEIDLLVVTVRNIFHAHSTLLEEHKLGSLRTKGAVYATAPTCLAFSSIAEELGHLSERYDSASVWAQCAWYRKPQPLYTDNAFRSLAAFVRSELRRLRICAVIIDNAQWLDIPAMQALIKVRGLLKGTVALIFCAPTERPGGLNEHVSNLIVASRVHDEFEQPIVLHQLEEKAFTGPILNALLEDRQMQFSLQLSILTRAQMRKTFWVVAQNDWHVIAKKIRGLDRLLGPRGKHIREITREAFEQVVGKLPQDTHE